MKKYLVAAAIAVAAGAASPAIAGPKPVELSAADLTRAQTRTYNVPANVAFNASVASLQTLGYVDIVASKDAGTVSGTTEAKAKVIYNIFWGFGKKKYTQKASLLIEDNGGPTSVVRLNLHLNESKSRGIWGTSFTDGKLVRVGEPYAEFYQALDAEVARRAPAGAADAALTPVSTTVLTPTPITR